MILKDIEKNPEIKVYLEKADKYLERVGYTEHGYRHCSISAQRARDVLVSLGYPSRIAELAAIAGYMHDIGNLLGRNNHGISGAIIVQGLLKDLKFPSEEITSIISAIANHEDEGGEIIDEITASLILGDKTDVHRSRVRNQDFISFDIHDRVNYAVTDSSLKVDRKEKNITLVLKIDTKISQVMEYFEIFLSRMVLCRKAADFLRCYFSLMINDVKLL